MTDEKRRQRILYANRQITKDGHAVCVCGQMFMTEDGYADHVATCTHSQRETAARGDWERD